jgi:hypothetical protein
MDVVEVEVIGEFTDRKGDEWAKVKIKGVRFEDEENIDVKPTAVIVLLEKIHYERPF